MRDHERALDIESGASAILNNYLPGFGLGERLILEEAIRICLIEKLGVPQGRI